MCHPSNCQVGQNNLVHFLPVPYGLDHDVTIECSVARNAPLLLDAGGWLVYEDPPECPGAFNKNDLKFFAAELAFGSGFGPTAVQSSAQLDGRPLPLTKLNVGPFDLSIGPGGPDECYQAYYNSVHLGHPGRLAHGYGGYKALVPGLTRGRHTVVSRIGFGGGAQHTVTYVITSR